MTTAPPPLPLMTEFEIRSRLRNAGDLGDTNMIDNLTDELVRIGKARPRKQFAPANVSLWGGLRRMKAQA